MMKAVKASPQIISINSSLDHISSLPVEIRTKIVHKAADSNHLSLLDFKLVSKEFQGLISDPISSAPIPRRVAAIHQLNNTIMAVDEAINLDNESYTTTFLNEQIATLDQAVQDFSNLYEPDLTIVLALFYLKLKADLYLCDLYDDKENATQLLRKVDVCRLFSKTSEEALFKLFGEEDFIGCFLPENTYLVHANLYSLMPIFISIRSKALTEGSFVHKACQMLMDQFSPDTLCLLHFDKSCELNEDEKKVFWDMCKEKKIKHIKMDYPPDSLTYDCFERWGEQGVLDDFTTLERVFLYNAYPIEDVRGFFKNPLIDLTIVSNMYVGHGKTYDISSKLLDDLLKHNIQVYSLETVHFFDMVCRLDEAKTVIEKVGKCFPKLKFLFIQFSFEEDGWDQYATRDELLSLYSFLLTVCPNLVRLDIDRYASNLLREDSQKAIDMFMKTLVSHQHVLEIYSSDKNFLECSSQSDFDLFGLFRQSILSILEQKNENRQLKLENQQIKQEKEALETKNQALETKILSLETKTSY